MKSCGKEFENVLIRVKDLQKADSENKSEIIEKNFKISLDII